jgi:predicted DNA-binding transcriptional regulator AlpA
MKAMELDEKVEDFQVQLQSDAEDCQMLSISRTTLWRMCKNDLRTMRIGGLVRIRKSDLDRCLRDHSERRSELIRKRLQEHANGIPHDFDIFNKIGPFGEPKCEPILPKMRFCRRCDSDTS